MLLKDLDALGVKHPQMKMRSCAIRISAHQAFLLLALPGRSLLRSSLASGSITQAYSRGLANPRPQMHCVRVHASEHRGPKNRR